MPKQPGCAGHLLELMQGRDCRCRACPRVDTMMGNISTSPPISNNKCQFWCIRYEYVSVAAVNMDEPSVMILVRVLILTSSQHSACPSITEVAAMNHGLFYHMRWHRSTEPSVIDAACRIMSHR